MNFLKITDKHDNDHYINFDLVYEFRCEKFQQFKDGKFTHSQYYIHFDIAYDNWSLEFKDEKDRDNKLALISHFLNLR